MNREDLTWALNAVLPHAAKRAGTIGIEYQSSHAYVYSLNPYSMAVARIPADQSVDVRLSPAEATELMRFLRPSRQAEREETVECVSRNGELHIGIESDTAVFSTMEPSNPVDLDTILSYIRRLYDGPEEYAQCVYQPDLQAKWAKAKRADSDRLRVFPRHSSDKYGVAVVTVGNDFIGAIAGLTYDQTGDEIVSSFLGLERNAA